LRSSVFAKAGSVNRIFQNIFPLDHRAGNVPASRFPGLVPFHRTKCHGARQIGNSVPPPLARAADSSLISAIQFPFPIQACYVAATRDPTPDYWKKTIDKSPIALSVLMNYMEIVQ